MRLSIEEAELALSMGKEPGPRVGPLGATHVRLGTAISGPPRLEQTPLRANTPPCRIGPHDDRSWRESQRRSLALAPITNPIGGSAAFGFGRRRPGGGAPQAWKTGIYVFAILTVACYQRLAHHAFLLFLDLPSYKSPVAWSSLTRDFRCWKTSSRGHPRGGSARDSQGGRLLLPWRCPSSSRLNRRVIGWPPMYTNCRFFAGIVLGISSRPPSHCFATRRPGSTLGATGVCYAISASGFLILVIDVELVIHGARALSSSKRQPASDLRPLHPGEAAHEKRTKTAVPSCHGLMAT